jgi:hypothetical protein
MPVPLPIEITDNFDQWRQKCNQAFQVLLDVVNENPVQTLIEMEIPVNNRDILLYDNTSQTFKNTLFDALIQDYLQDNGFRSDSKVKKYYFTNQNNLY